MNTQFTHIWPSARLLTNAASMYQASVYIDTSYARREKHTRYGGLVVSRCWWYFMHRKIQYEEGFLLIMLQLLAIGTTVSMTHDILMSKAFNNRSCSRCFEYQRVTNYSSLLLIDSTLSIRRIWYQTINQSEGENVQLSFWLCYWIHRSKIIRYNKNMEVLNDYYITVAFFNTFCVVVLSYPEIARKF